jgi:hypothetical protein
MCVLAKLRRYAPTGGAIDAYAEPSYSEPAYAGGGDGGYMDVPAGGGSDGDTGYMDTSPNDDSDDDV